MTLGEKIQLSRKKKGMSQEDLANLLNVSRQAVQKWESDASTPEVNKLIEISNVFDVSLDWLLKGVETKPNEEKPIEEEYVKEDKPSYKEEQSRNNEPYYLRPRGGIFTAARVFIIIGMILTPLSLVSSILGPTGSLFALLGLIMYVITIPLGVSTIVKLNTASDKRDVIPFGVFCIPLVSVLGGILVLAIDPKLFKDGNHPRRRTPVILPGVGAVSIESPKEVIEEPIIEQAPVRELTEEEKKERDRKQILGASIFLRILIFLGIIAVFVLSLVNYRHGAITTLAYVLIILTNIYTLIIIPLRSRTKIHIFFLLDISFVLNMIGAILIFSAEYFTDIDLVVAILAFVGALFTLLLVLIHSVLKKYEIESTSVEEVKAEENESDETATEVNEVEDNKEEANKKPFNVKAIAAVIVVIISTVLISITAPISKAAQNDNKYNRLVQASQWAITDEMAREFYYLVDDANLDYKETKHYISEYYYKRLNYIVYHYKYDYYYEMNNRLLSWFNNNTYKNSNELRFVGQNVHYYNKAKDMGRVYSNITDAKELKGYLNNLSDNYEDSRRVKDAFETIESARAKFGNGSTTAGKYTNPTNSQSAIYRNYLNDLADIDLGGTFFDLSKLVNSFDIRKIIFGADWSTIDGNYSFTWKENDEGTSQVLSHKMPDATQEGKSYYFDTYYDYDYYSTSRPTIVSNNITFSLVNQANDQDKFDLFKVLSVDYSSVNFVVKVEISYTHETVLMYSPRFN